MEVIDVAVGSAAEVWSNCKYICHCFIQEVVLIYSG